ncbi:MAG: hypothetical protein C4331_00415 [Meiothermus sp.]
MADKMKDAARAVRSKVNELADKARAAGHDIKADTSDNPVEKVSEKVKAAVDKGKAKAHETDSKMAANRAKK